MRLPIWDIPTRLFHWLLVGSVGICALTGFLLPANRFGWHFLAGYAIGLLLLFRLVWGFFGPEHSRWASFWPTPKKIIHHIKDLLAGQPTPSLGHNPVGGAMILALVAVLGGLVVTGLVVLGGQEKQGPLASLIPFATGVAVKEIHEFLAFLIVGMATLHVGGVLVESRLLRENLILSMILGHKEVPPGTPSPLPARRGPALTILGGLAVVIVAGAGTLNSRPVLGWRPLEVPAVYAKECGACHMAYHPSLLPTAGWNKIMGGLSDHFGEDASLSATATADITAWLTVNAAETWDTRIANRMRIPAATDRMTANPWWKRKHRHIPEATFQQASVKSHANCNACHGDAARGTFDKQNIAIPKP